MARVIRFGAAETVTAERVVIVSEMLFSAELPAVRCGLRINVGKRRAFDGFAVADFDDTGTELSFCGICMFLNGKTLKKILFEVYHNI